MNVYSAHLRSDADKALIASAKAERSAIKYEMVSTSIAEIDKLQTTYAACPNVQQSINIWASLLDIGKK